MDKTTMINDIIAEMQGLDREQIDRLKIIMAVKMHNYDVVSMETLPAVVTYDNDWALKRFSIDMMAKGLKESTIRSYTIMMRMILRDTHKNFGEITGQDISDYLALRQYQDKISINYKSALCRFVRVFFKWAYAKHHISKDIVLDMPNVRGEQKKKDRLTEMEIEEMRERCEDSRTRALLELMLSTGMRIGEIVALDVSHLDLAKGRIEIYGQKNNQYRTGFLSPKAIRALSVYLEETKAQRGTSGALFICKRKPYYRLTKYAVQKIAKGLGEVAGAHLKTTVHVYRKTFASNLYNKSNDIVLVSSLLGHSGTDITIKYYLINDLDEMQHKHKQAI